MPLMPTFWQSVLFWLKMGLLSFGGPAGQIALMHKELVEDKRWISENRFLHALNYCMILPGPEAQQLATYIGWSDFSLANFSAKPLFPERSPPVIKYIIWDNLWLH